MNRLPDDPQHPLWMFLRWLVSLSAITIVLWANASDFDITEARSITNIGILLGIGMGVEKKFFDSAQKGGSK